MPRTRGAKTVKVTVNDEAVEVDEQVTVAALLERLGFPDKGIAVAVDWTVLPRTQWQTALTDGARVEVVTAVQGG
jgi:sulfur carrier protein